MGSSIFAIMAKFAVGCISINGGEPSTASDLIQDAAPNLVRIQTPKLPKQTISPAPSSSPGVALPIPGLPKQGISRR